MIQIGKENATLFMLVRNWELKDALHSIRQIEDRFNRRFHYPWVFLNDEVFTPEFIRYTTAIASSPTYYDQIPKEHWSVPETVNLTRFGEVLDNMTKNDVIYGGSISYRNMCRFFSGFFFKQPLLQQYKYYWRVEPDTDFSCDIDYDIFEYMRVNKKRYGFTMAIPEFPETIPTLWNTTRDFAMENPQYLVYKNSLKFITDLNSWDDVYNLCHFWTNFEIADMDFYRSEAYQKYFEYLDAALGFFYERWGDAPIHTIAASLFLTTDEIHHFDDIGYTHAPWGRCPSDDESYTSGRCVCDRSQSFDYDTYSCMPRWFGIAPAGKGAQRYRRHTYW
ncbi:glycosyltransferase family 15 protein [Tortispora caseinolytica NRRL Y-17796]|uniref:Glycosyltransferase family 15 protein n=1 Tax=Tortispora caseinolytica NRRL Y-17796 TaxID=767744 RepID=A0A1E4T9N6_9ASCO|nr:glycosyltransferase family 15 protein [Tortispora caseinolytica NRRL Y-17796]